MKRQAAYLMIGLLAGVFATACNDPILPVGAENSPELTNEPDAFHYKAFDLQNVHDTLTWTWTNNGTTANVTHEDFLPHGESRLFVRDADGVVVYDGPLESPQAEPIVRETRPGRPGAWTLELRLYGIDGGRIDFRVERAPES